MEGKDVREVNLELVPLLEGETYEEAATRHEADGYVLENTPELAAFFQQYPEEVSKVSKHGAVLALGKNSRWKNTHGAVFVPCACVFHAQNRLRGFIVETFDSRVKGHNTFVLVSRKLP